jgi:hypothetical protein
MEVPKMNALVNRALKGARKVLLPGVAGLLAIAVSAHFAWKYSGSNEWKLVRDANGVKVYTLKAPGSTLLKLKAEMQVKTSLSSAVFLLRGDESSADEVTSGERSDTNFKVIERYETPSVFMAYYSAKQPMPPPMRTRELVILLNYAQDPKSKQVVINVQAAPTKIPPTPNTSRVTHLNNIFRLTPSPNGELNWEVTLDVDMGVFYPIANSSLVDWLLGDLSYHKKLVLTEKYQKAKLVSVQEL